MSRARLLARYRNAALRARLACTEIASRLARVPRLRGRDVLGWLAVAGVLAWLQASSVLGSLRHTLKDSRTNGDALQQIFPFFKYFAPTAGAFEGDYVAKYYLDCYPLGYWGLYAGAAKVGVDPTLLSRCLPHPLWLISVVCLGLAVNKLSGKIAALCAMALALGSNEYLDRIGGGLPRSFGFPVLAGALMALAYGRVWWCAVCVVLGALFYPVAAVISGLALAGMVLASRFVGSEASAWSWTRRFVFLTATAALAALLLVPSSMASGRYGGVVRPSETREFPEVGSGGRYDRNSRAPFRGFFASLPVPVEEGLVGARPLSEAARGMLEERREHGSSARFDALRDVLFVLVLAGGVGLVVRRRAARRVLLLAVASGVGHAVARLVVPYAYLPERYVAYSIPLLAALAVATAFSGLFPKSFDLGLRSSLRVTFTGVYVAAVLFFLVGGVTPTTGAQTDLATTRRLCNYIARLPPTALVAGWPKGAINRVPFAARRRALLTYETHQVFHRDYTVEMRRRTRALIDAYFATSVEPIVRLRDELGVTHLIVDRTHFTGKPPSYFRPFNRWIAARERLGRGESFELPRQIRTARVFADDELVVLDLSRIASGRRAEAPGEP